MMMIESGLKWLLILSGGFLMTAFAATLLPVSVMSDCHEWLGLGEFSAAPITLYLARSTSLLYGVHGVLMLYAGLTIERHWRFVHLFGILHIVIGTAVFLIDWTSPMPLYWILLEGPPVAGLGVLILVLARRAFPPKTSL